MSCNNQYVLHTNFTSSYRETLYLNGGVLFVTSRILVVDMLTKKLPIHLVTGIVVCKAHKYVLIRCFSNVIFLQSILY